MDNIYTPYQVTLLDCRNDLIAMLGRLQALDQRDRDRSRGLVDDIQRTRLRIDAEFDRPKLTLAK